MEINKENKEIIKNIQVIKKKMQISENMEISKKNVGIIKENKFKEICQKYEINYFFASKIRILEQFKIVIICHDFSNFGNQSNYLLTKRNEIKKQLKIIIDIVSILDHKGIDIYFLNGKFCRNINDQKQVEKLFIDNSIGCTPLVSIFKNIFNEQIPDKRLIILATCGVSTDNEVNNIKSLKYTLKYERAITDYVSILPCMNDQSVRSYFNKYNISQLNVIENYKKEKKQIMKIKGKNFSFSYGDYIIKSMLESVDPYNNLLNDNIKICGCVIS